MNCCIHLQECRPSQLPFLARELDSSSLTMYSALELKLDLLIAISVRLAFKTVSTLKMLEFGVGIVSGYSDN